VTDRVADEHVDVTEEASKVEDPGTAPESAEVVPDPDSPFAGLADVLAASAQAEEESVEEVVEEAVEEVAETVAVIAEEATEDVAETADAIAEDAAAEAVEEVAEVVEDAAAETAVEEVAAETATVEVTIETDPVVEAQVEEPAAEAPAEEPAAEAPAAEAADEDVEEEPVEPVGPSSPYDLPGSWYVIHSYSGYENKVRANLETRIHSMHMEESIFDVVIPMEDVVEFKGGRKVTVPKKQFPGYLLVRLYLDDDSWSVVRNTPGVTGFVGSASKPTPLSRREVERILGVRKDEEKKAPRYKPDWEIGETVRVVEGPFADFNGVIEDINVDQSKVRVLVDIFGRETPVELNFEQIQKF
jgi:transcriptional antiterminator NusG